MLIDWAHFTPIAALAGGLLIGLAAALFLLLHGRIMGVSGLIAELLTGGLQLTPGRYFILGTLAAPLLWYLFLGAPQIDISTGWLPLLLAGLLVGFGTRLGSGCTSGHGVCGLARLSPRSLVATLAFMGSGFATVYVLRHALA